MQSCLIVGNPSAFTKALIDRLDREGVRMFTLSMEKTDIRQEHVFEQYQFDDTGDGFSGVISSCRPEKIIFMGAWDSCFTRDDARARETRRNYISTLSELLISASKHGTGHFLYLSGDCVFSDNYVSDINEDMPASPDTHEQTIVYQGETLALRYDRVSAMEVTVARLGGLYFAPRSESDCADEVTGMCLRALRGETLMVNDKHTLSALYESDAVEAVYVLLSAPARARNLYHVASREYFTERDLAFTIAGSIVDPVKIDDITSGLSSQRILSSAAFDSEFGFAARVSYKEAVPRVVKSMRERLRDFQAKGGYEEDTRLTRILFRALSYLELLAGFALCVFLTGKLSAEMSDINLFLLYSLLFAIFYGSRHGIIAASLSAVGYCFLELGARSGLELLIDVNTYVWIAQVFIVALAAGNVRDQLTQTKKDMGEEITFLNRRLTGVTRINDSNVQIKNFFERHMVDSDESIGNIYSIIADMDKAESGAVLFAATSILMEFMGTKDVAIYRMMGGGYSRLAASSSPRARSLGKSVTLGAYPDMYSCLEDKRVYVNRRLDGEMPYLADTLTDPDGKVNFAILLWDLNYEHMTLYYINLLRVICALIGNAVARSANYLDALAHTRLIEGSEIMRPAAFDEMVRVYREASARRLADYCLLTLHIKNMPFDACERILSGMLRHTDMLGMVDDMTLGILLTNTSAQEGLVVVNRLRAKGLRVTVREGEGI